MAVHLLPSTAMTEAQRQAFLGWEALVLGTALACPGHCPFHNAYAFLNLYGLFKLL